MASWIFLSVVNRPTVILKEDSASSVDNPRAFNTWEGSGIPLVHADPVEKHSLGCNDKIGTF